MPVSACARRADASPHSRLPGWSHLSLRPIFDRGMPGTLVKCGRTGATVMTLLGNVDKLPRKGKTILGVEDRLATQPAETARTYARIARACIVGLHRPCRECA